MSLDKFMNTTRADVENVLRQRILNQSDKTILWKTLNGGKRLRPILCILSFRAIGGRDEDYGVALDVAAAVELGHCASLTHDDIVDRDVMRRGRPALWVDEGITKAIIAGHRGISLGLMVSLSHGAEIAESLLNSWDKTLRGGQMETNARQSRIITPNEYLKIIENKTASLFSVASKVGSQVAHAPGDIQNLIEEYGKAVGMAYQIADDLSDLHVGKADELLSMVVLTNKQKKMSLLDFMSDKMETEIKKAEILSRDRRIPENEFKSYLAQVPRLFVGQIFKEVGIKLSNESKRTIH